MLRVYGDEGTEVVAEGKYEGVDTGEMLYTGDDGYSVLAIVEPAFLDLAGDEYDWITVDAEDEMEEVESEAEEAVELDALELV